MALVLLSKSVNICTVGEIAVLVEQAHGEADPIDAEDIVLPILFHHA